ncbi:MAG: hypothetical protein ABIW32_05960 [Terrimesophilobacter sp.]
MPEAPRERPHESVVLHDLHSHIRARPRAVFDSLKERFDPGESAQSFFTADAAAWLVIVQGGWWYRAEYRIIPDDFGSRIEHVLLNVAGSSRGLGRLAGRRLIESAPAEFERLITSLRAELE